MIAADLRARLQSALQTLPALAILFAFFAGLIFVVAAPVEMKKMSDARSWPSRPGVITQSSASITYSRRRGDRWSYVIRGTFSDTGDPFALTKVRYGQFLLGRRESDSKAVVARYPVGAPVRVFYSPSNPRQMILEPDAPMDDMLRLFFAGLALVLLPVALFAWGKLRRSARVGNLPHHVL